MSLKTKYKDHKYVKSTCAAQLVINNPRFVNMEEFDDEMYEFELQKKKIKQDMFRLDISSYSMRNFLC